MQFKRKEKILFVYVVTKESNDLSITIVKSCRPDPDRPRRF